MQIYFVPIQDFMDLSLIINQWTLIGKKDLIDIIKLGTLFIKPYILAKIWKFFLIQCFGTYLCLLGSKQEYIQLISITY